MDIINIINELKLKLNMYPSIKTYENIGQIVTSNEEIKKIEESLHYKLPIDLKKIYLKYGNGLYFKWYDDNNVFGKFCKWGEFNLISLKEILNSHLEMIDMVNEALKNQSELKENDGLQSLVNDWNYWFPILSFKNGDSFCLDKRDNTIRFLEHDVMDGGPNIHGLKIANNFEELITNWSIISFVDIYYWDKVIDENGININSEIFINLI
jgi:hypothetical protein